MIKAIILFAIGLVLLIKGGDWFVDGATGLAYRFRIPELLIGATVVSIGTTLPEVMVSAASAVGGHSEIAYGNAIGSIICNTSLIAALTMAIRPAKTEPKSLRLPVVFFFAAAAFYAVISYTSGMFSRVVGCVLLAGFLAYMVFQVRQAVGAGNPAERIADSRPEAETEGNPEGDTPLWKQLLLLIVGAACIAVGADLLVDNGTILAEELHVPESVIAVTFVALGTSLPELITAITSLVKGHSALSVGNIIGANLFNLVLVSGLAVTLNPFSIPTEKLFFGVNASLAVDIPLMVIVMALMTLPIMKTGRMKRWQGILLLGIYIAYCVFQFAL